MEGGARDGAMTTGSVWEEQFFAEPWHDFRSSIMCLWLGCPLSRVLIAHSLAARDSRWSNCYLDIRESRNCRWGGGCLWSFYFLWLLWKESITLWFCFGLFVHLWDDDFCVITGVPFAPLLCLLLLFLLLPFLPLLFLFLCLSSSD